MTEVWKAIPGFEGAYEVSDLGRVRSLDRVLTSPTAARGYPRRVRGQVLVACEHGAGYLQVGLGKVGTRLVNHLVLEAFVGPRPPGMDACHNDGKKHNNTLLNLRWDTPTANAADKVLHGTAPRGERNGCAKLTVTDVLHIRDRSSGDRHVLAVRYGVRATHIDRIRARGRWAHV